MVADALYVLGNEQQMRAGRYVARILHHVGEQFAKQSRVHLVDLLVAMPNIDSPIGVVVGIGVEHVLDDRLHQLGHARDGACRFVRR